MGVTTADVGGQGRSAAVPFLAAFCMAVSVAGGAFDPRARVIAAFVASAGAIVFARTTRLAPFRWAPLAFVALPLFLSAATNDWPRTWTGEAVLLVIVAAVTRIGSWVSFRRALEICAGVGASLAVLGIVGILLKLEPLAIDASPWRIGASVGYQNAAGTIFAITFVSTLVLTGLRPNASARAMATLTGIGLLGTMSRGALVAAMVALGALVVMRCRFDARIGGWVLVGAVALAPAAMEMRFGGLVTASGVTIAVLLAARTSTPPRRATVFALGALALVVALGAATALGTRDARTSNQRLAVWGATLAAMDEDAITGTGPGTYRLVRIRDGQVVTTKHAHNEYVEVLSEQGVVGLLGMLAALGLIARRILHMPNGSRRSLGFAVLALVAVQASLDFILHIPAVLAIATLVIASATSPQPMEDT